jgi:hypothetical protein
MAQFDPTSACWQVSSFVLAILLAVFYRYWNSAVWDLEPHLNSQKNQRAQESFTATNMQGN